MEQEKSPFQTIAPPSQPLRNLPVLQPIHDSAEYFLEKLESLTFISVTAHEALFCQAIEYALKGGAVDFTGNEDIDYWETICDEVRVCKGIKRMLNAGVNPNRITISSDGQGSLPIYNKKGEFQGMDDF